MSPQANPFYALELARAIDTGSTAVRLVLPGSLAELMCLRIGRLDRDAQDMLLTAASVADPTVELLARVTYTSVDHATDLLEEAESKGLISIDGHRVRFAHPLLARTIYTDASLCRHTEADPLIEALEGNGRRNDCAWMLAVGARCRSMSLAARGDVDAAEQMARQALVEHERIPIRFERARTELVLGQLQRRQRKKTPPQRP